MVISDLTEISLSSSAMKENTNAKTTEKIASFSQKCDSIVLNLVAFKQSGSFKSYQ